MHWLIERERNLRTVLQPRSEACLSGAPGHAPDVMRPYLRRPQNLLHPVQDSVLTLRPSAALTCSDCVQLGKAADGSPVLDIPPSLTDFQLLPLLEPYRRYRVWRLSMDSVGSPQRAFGGFADAAAAANFDARMERITGEWCCR